jgi:hypothetical protein
VRAQAAAAVLVAGNLHGADAAGCEGSCPSFLVMAVIAVVSALCVLWYRCSCVCYSRKRAKVQDLAVLDDVVVNDDDFSGPFSLVHRLRGSDGPTDEAAAESAAEAAEVPITKTMKGQYKGAVPPASRYDVGQA